MAVAKVIEINAASKNSFEDAIAAGIAKASRPSARFSPRG